MNRIFFATLLLIGLSACVRPQIDPLVRELSGAAAAPARSPAELRAAYDQLLDGLLLGMGAANIADREGPQQAFEKVCFHASRPKAEVERRALCEAIVARLGPQTSKPARVWLLRQIERIGAAESVPALAELLDETDTELRDLARRALQLNPSAGAGDALRAALARAEEPTWQVALINALGARRDAASVSPLAALARAERADVANAACAALADIASLESLAALEELCANLETAAPAEQAPRADALLRCADALRARGQAERAAAAYALLARWQQAPLTVRMGVWRGRAAREGAELLPTLLQIVADHSAAYELRALAAQLAAEIPGTMVTAALAQALPGAAPEAQSLLLGALAARGDPTAAPVVTAQLASDNEEVRLAAIRALQVLGDQTSALPLAHVAAESAGPVQEAARRSLARLRSDGVDVALLTALPASAAAVRVEIIRAFSARRVTSVLPVLLEQAGSGDDAVRIAASAALGELATDGDTPKILKLLLEAESEAVRQAIEDALVALRTRVATGDERAAPILAVWDEVTSRDRVSLLRVLGRLGGAATLDRIRTARQAQEPEVQDAAIRALCQWPSNEVLTDVLEVARTSENKTHRVLALQSFVRLLGLPSDRTPEATLTLYRTALALSERPEEKRLVLGGLATVRQLEALRMAERQLEDSAVAAEAEAAVLALAELLGPFQRPEARAAVQRLAAQTKSEATQKRCAEVLDALRAAQGNIVTWQVAGPYHTPQKDWNHVYAHAYAPERGTPPTEWRDLATTNDKRPWVYDLTKLDKDGDRCVYVRSFVWSEREQPVQLLVGSDDAVKVWLNGRLVHEFKGIRGHEPLKDRVPATLKAGWNTLLLKVVQCSGGWGFSAAVKSPAGEPLEGLRFDAAPPAH